MSKNSIYLQIQLAVFIVFYLAFVFCGARVLLEATPPPAVKEIFNELKTLFLGLMAIESLKHKINEANGLEADHAKPAADPATPAP